MKNRFNQRKQLFSNETANDPGQGPSQSFFESLDLASKNAGGATIEPGPVDPNAATNSNEPALSIVPEPTEPSEPAADDRVKALETQIQTLMGMMQNQTPAPQAPAEPLPPEPTSPFESDSFDNLSKVFDWSHDEAGAMKNFLQQVTDFSNTNTLNEATSSITNIVNSAMSASEKRQSVRTKFFTDNPALKPMNLYVNEMAKNVANEFKSQGKAMDPAAILNEAATRSYTALGITKQPSGNAPASSQSARDTNPAFASNSGQGVRSPQVKKTETAKMIDAIIDLT